MSAKLRNNISQVLPNLPTQIEQNILRGGVRALLVVIADEASNLCISPEVRSAIHVSVRAIPGLITGKIMVRGPGAYIAPWLEHGTDPHFITVEDDLRQGHTVRKINKRGRQGSLVVKGKFVGPTVHHPGAKPHPFLRPALDIKLADGVVAMKGYVMARSTKEGLATPPADAE